MARDLFQEAGIVNSGAGRDLFAEAGITPDTKKAQGGLKSAAMQAVGQGVRGAGQLAADFVPGLSQDNALTRQGEEIIQANPTAVHSLEDIAAQPWTAFKEATGNAVGSMASMIGAKGIGEGIAMLPHPIAKIVGKGISYAGPVVAAGAPSYGGIRQQQIQGDAARTDDMDAKLRALGGAAAVGAIETRFGPQEWALSAMTKQGRAKLAEKFAAHTLPGAVVKGGVRGAAVEGAEELAQNPIEQVASYQDPTTQEAIKDTLFGGAMGALGGGLPGGVMGGASHAMRGGDQGEGEPLPANEILGGVPDAQSGQASPAMSGDKLPGSGETSGLGEQSQAGTKPVPGTAAQPAAGHGRADTAGPAGRKDPALEALAPRGLSDLDRVGEIDAADTRLRGRLAELNNPANGYGPMFDQERQDIMTQRLAMVTERNDLAKHWPNSVSGAPAEFTTESGARINSAYALMEADDLVASHDENLRKNQAYPQELQPRERDRAASEMQVSGIVQRLDPARLGESADAGTGAPIVGMDGLVESGNARTIALKRVYRANGLKADNYRRYLKDNAARFGLTPEQVDSMRRPVLVRVRQTPVDRAEFARQANAATVAQMSPSEQARTDAARVDNLDGLNPDENGEFTTGTSRDFIRRFMGRLPTTEQAGMIDASGALSQTGYARVRNAVLAKAYGDSPVLLRMVESLDDNTRNLTKALVRVAPRVAQVRQAIAEGRLYDADLIPDLVAAVEEISRLKDSGVSIQDYLAQTGMFNDGVSEETRDLMQFMQDNIRRPAKIAEFIHAYMDGLEALGNPNQGSLLGESSPPGKGDIVKAAKRNTDGQVSDRGATVPEGGEAGAVNRGQPGDEAGNQGGPQGNEGARRQAVDQQWNEAMADLGAITRDFVGVARMMPEDTPNLLPTLVKLSEAAIYKVGYKVQDIIKHVKAALKGMAEFKTVWNKIPDSVYRKAAEQAAAAIQAGEGDLFTKAGQVQPDLFSQTIEGAKHAIQKPIPAKVDVRQRPEDGGKVGEGNATGQEVAGEGQAKTGGGTEGNTNAVNVSQVHKENGPSQAKKAVAQPVSPIEAHNKLFKALREGTATLDEYKAGLDKLMSSEDAIKAELNGMTKDAIFKAVPGVKWRYKNDKKDVVVRAAFRDMLDDFAIGRSASWMMGEKYENVIRSMVERTTQEDLNRFAQDEKSWNEEKKAKVNQAMEAIKSPKTLEDFYIYLRAKKSEGMNYAQARMTLSPEQRATYDEMAGEKTRDERRARADQQKTSVTAPSEAVGASEIIKTKHTKHGHDLWQFTLDRRVPPDEFKSLVAQAKRMGGDYSSYRGNGAIPGWQFRTEEAARAFRELVGGNANAARDVMQARRDAFMDDRSQSAVERLTEMADRLEERADASLSVDRKANTARRARFAARAEAAANADKAMATTMRNIAQAIADGKAKFLDRVRQKAQVEMLRGFVRSAKDDELRQKYPAYIDYEKHQGEKPTGETADHAKFPSYTAFRSDLASLGRQLEQIDGTKKLGASLLKVADDVTSAYLKFAKENLHKVSTFSRAEGKPAIFASKEQAEEAIKRSGFKGKAVVLPFKRGQNIIIMSPSAAKENGIWPGDDDKRITLTADFGAELVEKVKAMGRANRVSLPWIFESAYDARKRLSGIGIETPAEFRAALREFIALQEQPAAPDKIKEMERAMIGRRNDGLDFFPTPASVAREMVETADIKEGMTVLEPSAGMGHIAEQIREAGIDPDVVEMSFDRRELLTEKGFNLVGSDFMDVSGEYDRIVMNPPFSNRRDIEHVRHAYELLKPGGRIVAIMGEGSFFGSDKKATEFREWLDSLNGTSEKLEDGAFLDPTLPVNTGVAARMVVIDKPAEAPRLSRAIRADDFTIIENPTRDQAENLLRRSKYQSMRGLRDPETGKLYIWDANDAIHHQVARELGITDDVYERLEFDDVGALRKGVFSGEPGYGGVITDRPSAYEVREIRMSRKGGAAKGISLRDLNAMVDRVRKSMDNLPTVHVLTSPMALDLNNPSQARLREFIEQAGAMDDAEGATHEGEIYLFASGLEDEARAEHVLAIHETTHYGLRAVFGKELDPVLQSIWVSNAAVRKQAQALRQKYGLASNVAAVEEVLADMEPADLVKLKGWRRLVQVVKDWLLAHGFTAMAARMDALMKTGMDGKAQADMMVADVVNAAREWVRNGKTGRAGAVTGTQLYDAILSRMTEDRGPGADLTNQPTKPGSEAMPERISIDGVERHTRNSNGDQIANTEDGVVKFWEWFGESVVVDDIGRPRVVYHGSKVAGISEFDTSKSRDIGTHFSTTDLSEKFGGNKYIAYLKIENPAEVGDIFSIDGGDIDVYGKKVPGAIDNAFGLSSTDADTLVALGKKVERQWDESRDADNTNKPAYKAFWKKVRSLATQEGIDGFEYKNLYEGGGISYAVFDKSQIKIINDDPSFNRSGQSSGRTNLSRASQSQLPGVQQSQTVADRANAIIAKPAATARPVDALVKAATQATGIAKLASAAYDKAGFFLDRYTPETIKAGVVADYGIPEAVLDQRALMQGRMRVQLRKTGELIDKLSTLTREESRIAYMWMNADNPQASDYLMQQLPPESIQTLAEVEKMIDRLSREAVALGQLDPEAFKRNRYAYLRRSYVKHTAELTPGEAKRRGRTIAILGDQYKGRGMVEGVAMRQIQNVAPEWWGRKFQGGKADKGLKNERFIRLERREPAGEGTTPIPGIGDRTPGRVLQVAYWPASEPMPAKFKDWNETGTWEVRDTQGDKLILWRDFTAQERQAMGEIDEARFAIAKTLHGMVHDVEVGRYLEWLAQRHAKKDGAGLNVVKASEKMKDTFAPGEWVEVPDTKIPGTKVLKYGILAGRYLPGPIWNDVRQVTGGKYRPLGDVYAAILSAWKTSKTTLSPTVHTNNVMANLVMADWHDVTAGHVAKALRIMLGASDRKGEGALGKLGNLASRAGHVDREAAREIMNRFTDSGGSIGTWATAELQREQLEPMLKALEQELAQSGNSPAAQVGAAAALQHLLRLRFPSAWQAIKPTNGAKAVATEAKSMIDLYEAEDQVFRLAAWLKAKEDGADDLEAGKVARKSFLDYHINAPWIQAARQTALPFLAFTYRAVPMLLETIGKKPWKIMKLALLAGMVNALGYAMSGGDEDDERKLLPEEKAGRIWGLVPKLIRMPWNDPHGSPVFLDVRRWVPVGDVFDLGQQHAAVPILPAAVPGGPLALLAELFANKSQFTGKSIVQETDTPMEQAGKVLDHIYKAFAPNLIFLPGTYAFTSAMNAGTGKTDSFGREQSTAQAIVSAHGIKVGAYPRDQLLLNEKMHTQAMEAEISRNIAALKRERLRNGISQAEFDQAVAEQMAKKKALREAFAEKAR